MYRVMVVDDDATTLAICKALLEDEFDLQLMSSGVQALGALKNARNHPDVILMDLKMPGLSGKEVLKSLQEDDGLREVPVLFLTAEQSWEGMSDCYRLGATDFIQKPINSEVLHIKISRAIRGRQLARENQELRELLRSMKDQIDKHLAT